MKYFLLCSVAFVAVSTYLFTEVSSEACVVASNCTLEDCGQQVVTCERNICTCQTGTAGGSIAGGGHVCASDGDCMHDHSIHCPPHNKHCDFPMGSNQDKICHCTFDHGHGHHGNGP